MERDLVQIVDAALAEAVRRGGAWIACKAGCCQCCLGPFPITQLDAARLREGLAALGAADPGRAGSVRERAERAARKMGADFRFDESEEFDEEPCPALDPGSGTCDLYEWRPLTCRTFGPAIRWDERAVGICELCFVGASEEEIAACEIALEGVPELSESGDTLVAFALAQA